MNEKNSQPDCECDMVDFLYEANKEVFRHRQLASVLQAVQKDGCHLSEGSV